MHTYVDISLVFAMKMSKYFDVSIELIQDGNPNAYLYNKDHIYTREIFEDWFEKLNQIKERFPKNKLAKHLMSSVWGTLTKRRVAYKTQEQIDNEGLDVDFVNAEWIIHNHHIYESESGGQREVFELVNSENPYYYQLRIKPYLTAFSRCMTAFLALQDIENVIRCQTDNVTFKKAQTFSMKNVTAEAKTTGRIKWINCDKYINEQIDSGETVLELLTSDFDS